MHRPNVHNRPIGVQNARKFVNSLTFDVIHCTFIYGCEVANGVVLHKNSVTLRFRVSI